MKIIKTTRKNFGIGRYLVIDSIRNVIIIAVTKTRRYNDIIVAIYQYTISYYLTDK